MNLPPPQAVGMMGRGRKDGRGSKDGRRRENERKARGKGRGKIGVRKNFFLP